MKPFFLILFVLLTIVSRNSFAANEGVYKDLIEKYVHAITTQDAKKIYFAWAELNKLPDALVYMEKNTPSVAYSFKKIGLSIKLSKSLDQFLATYPKNKVSSGTFSTETYKKRIKQTNTDIVDANKNQDQESNQEQAERDKKAGLITNQAAVANAANQNQRSNSDLMQDEANRMRQGN